MINKLLLTTALCASFALSAHAADKMKNGMKLADDQTFTYRVLDDYQSLDLHISTDVEGAAVFRDLFEGLVNDDPQGGQIPGAAASWALSDDKLTYTFTLRDAKWSNGDPVTAQDFVYAWQRLANPKTAAEYAWYMELMGVKNAKQVIAGEMEISELGVKAVDDKTFEVQIETALPYFISMLTHASTFPVPQKVVEELGADWVKPGSLVGNGAYVLTEYSPGEKLVRERNNMYWNDAETVIEKTVALIINDENQGLTRYLSDEVDKTNVPAGQFPRLKGELPTQTFSNPRSCSYVYWMNMGEKGPEALKDVRVRKALAYTLDRKIIVENILQAGQYESYNFTHRATANFKLPNLEWANWTQAERDEKAKALLAEAGYGADNPLKLTISYNTDEAHKKIAIAAQQFWKQKLGAQIELSNNEWKVHLTNMRNGDFDLARYAWCGDYNEASTYLDLLTSTSNFNQAKFASAEYDRLIEESKTQADPSDNYQQAAQIVADVMPIAPIYQYTSPILVKEDVQGWPHENLMQNWYSRDMYKIAK